MPRTTFEQDLKKLQDAVLDLGSMVSQSIRDATDILQQWDTERAAELIARDREMNRKRFAIEEETLVLIATQQPMAVDLRTLAAVLEITTELERMGDYAKGIAKITQMLKEPPPIPAILPQFKEMTDLATGMLKDALQCFVDRDVEQARMIPSRDDQVDALYNSIAKQIFDFIREHPKKQEEANYMLWVAHNLERAADRVTNICERVIFTVTGELVEMDVKEEEGGERRYSDLF